MSNIRIQIKIIFWLYKFYIYKFVRLKYYQIQQYLQMNISKEDDEVNLYNILIIIEIYLGKPKFKIKY